MELYEANKILRNAKSIFASLSIKIPPQLETDGLLILLDKLDPESYLRSRRDKYRAKDFSSAKLSVFPLFVRTLQILTGRETTFTSVTLSLMHKRLCGDIDRTAGVFRNRSLSTNGCEHADYRYIGGSLKSITAKMNEAESSPQLSKEDFATLLTHYMRELIILCPFEKYNILFVDVFCVVFAKAKGFSLSFYKESPLAVKSAQDSAFYTDDVTPLYKSLITCLSYETKTVAQYAKTRRELNAVTPTDVKKTKPKTHTKLPAVKTDDSVSEPVREVSATVHEPTKSAPDDVLRRVVKLQQKIAKLNEQLNELIKPYK